MIPQGLALAQVHGDLAVPGTHTDTPHHPHITPFQAAVLGPRGVPDFGSCVTVPTPQEVCWPKVVWDLQGQMSGEITTQPHGLVQGSLNRKGWQLHAPPLDITEAGLQDEACHPLDHFLYPAAQSLVEMELDLRKDLPTMLGSGFRWVRALGMREGATSEAEWAVRWGKRAISAIVPGRRKSSHVGQGL